MSVIGKEVTVGFFDETGDYSESELVSGNYYRITIVGKFENSVDDELIFVCDHGDEEISINVEDICEIERE